MGERTDKTKNCVINLEKRKETSNEFLGTTFFTSLAFLYVTDYTAQYLVPCNTTSYQFYPPWKPSKNGINSWTVVGCGNNIWYTICLVIHVGWFSCVILQGFVFSENTTNPAVSMSLFWQELNASPSLIKKASGLNPIIQEATLAMSLFRTNQTHSLYKFTPVET